MGWCQVAAYLCKIYGFRTLNPKDTGSVWRICKRKVRCLDLFSRVQSAVCGSCVYLLTHARLQPHWWQSTNSSIHGTLQARMLQCVPIHFFHVTSSFSNFVNILFLFQSLFTLLMLGPPCCEWAFSSCSYSARASHCSGFSCFGAQDLETASVHSYGPWALEHRLSSCGPWT